MKPVVPFLFLLFASQATAQPIYGSDDRIDADEPSALPDLVAIARGTVLIADQSKISSSPDPLWKTLAVQDLGTAKNICPDQPFVKQPVLGFCTGFLAGPDLVVTAGHCVRNTIKCGNMAMVFGFSYAEGDPVKGLSHKDNVYTCRSVVAFMKGGEEDFAILRLDRPVVGRQPLAIRRKGMMADDADIAVLGYPSGLPLKIVPHLKIRANDGHRVFITNADVFVGNSGSPIINVRTGLVEGVLVRGEKDFVFRGPCRVLHHCQDDEGYGEEAIRSAVFAPYLP